MARERVDRETGSTKLSKLTKLPAAKETIRQAKADDTVTVATHTQLRRGNVDCASAAKKRVPDPKPVRNRLVNGNAKVNPKQKLKMHPKFERIGRSNRTQNSRKQDASS